MGAGRPRRRLRRRLSDRQEVLYPALGALVRAWCALQQRRVPYAHEGPLLGHLAEGRPCIVALWHQDVFPLMFELFRFTPAARPWFLVSHGRTGRVGSHLLGLYGFRCVAGSRRRRGVRAVEALAARVRAEPRSVFLMADGSRGPAGVARWGAVHLARDTGLPLVPVRGWTTHLWILERSWMRLAIPKPAGRGVVLSGSPIRVPAEARSREALEPYRAALERALNGLAEDARAWAQEARAAFG